MKKSKHFRKDVILARVIAGVLLIVLIVLLAVGISLLEKPSGHDKESQNSQNSEYTEDLQPGGQDTQQQGTEDTQQAPSSEIEGLEPGPDENDETTYQPEIILWIKTTATLNLREEPNTRCTTLERIPEETRVGVLEDLDGWYKVIYNGKEGYVSKTYVVVLPEE